MRNLHDLVRIFAAAALAAIALITALVIVALAGCAVEGARCDGGAGTAYPGFRWACAHAPPCPTAVACGDDRWRAAGAATLDAASRCLLGPCEVRGPCLADAVAACAIDDGGPPPDRSTLYIPAWRPR